MRNDLTGSSLQAQWGPRTPTKTCPDGQLLWIHVDTGLPVVEPCRKNACLQCVRPKVRQVERAARFSCPNAFITLTQLDCDDEVNRNSMNLLTRYLGRDGLDLAMVWAAEPNPNQNGVHVHAWSRGDIPTIDVLQSRATQVGIGSCQIKPVTDFRNLGYLCKMATWNEAALEAYRAVNGNELVHGRPFWWDPETGEGLSRKEAATRQRALDYPGGAQRYRR